MTYTDDVVILDGAEAPETRCIDVAGGTAWAYTGRDPEKATPNEDTTAIVPYGPGAAVFVVADGAGGLPAGKRASLTAVETFAASLYQSMEATMQLRTAVLNGIEAANVAVLALANGSATTMTVLTVEGTFARAYQVGDSEALIVGQRGAIRLQTTPHSPTGFAVEAGFLDQRDALLHADRHLVSNFVGTSEMTIDVGAGIELRPRDTIVVASDGLTDNVHLDETIEAVRKGGLEPALERVTAMALQRMRAADGREPSKPDDLSVILFRRG